MLADADYAFYDEHGTGDFAQARRDTKIQANAMFITFRIILCQLVMLSGSNREEVGIIMQFSLPFPDVQQILSSKSPIKDL